MTNRDRLLQFLYDTKHIRQESLLDIKESQHKFYMTRYDGEELIYLSNGGTQAILFVFTLKGRFKYKCTVDLPHVFPVGKDGGKLPGRRSAIPRRENPAQ